MTNLSTDARLLALLKEVSGRPLSAEEVKKQKISYVMGFVGEKSGVTKERVSEILVRQEGEAA